MFQKFHSGHPDSAVGLKRGLGLVSQKRHSVIKKRPGQVKATLNTFKKTATLQNARPTRQKTIDVKDKAKGIPEVDTSFSIRNGRDKVALRDFVTKKIPNTRPPLTTGKACEKKAW